MPNYFDIFQDATKSRCCGLKCFKRLLFTKPLAPLSASSPPERKRTPNSKSCWIIRDNGKKLEDVNCGEDTKRLSFALEVAWPLGQKDWISSLPFDRLEKAVFACDETRRVLCCSSIHISRQILAVVYMTNTFELQFVSICENRHSLF